MTGGGIKRYKAILSGRNENKLDGACTTTAGVAVKLDDVVVADSIAF